MTCYSGVMVVATSSGTNFGGNYGLSVQWRLPDSTVGSATGTAATTIDFVSIKSTLAAAADFDSNRIDIGI